jgi:pimeloyl-ACP methyl ester carboxylesterase
MTLTTSPTIHTVAVPGATLHYEVRGAAASRGGPLLFVIGSPMAAAEFAPLADALASSSRTVVTYDPRGIGNSTIDDPAQDSTPELRADDVVAILDALGAESADVFGSSGGAVTGLALVERHPGRVRILVAHEPPLLELLPDADKQRASTEDIIATYHADGMQAAWFKFMVNAGFPDPGAGQVHVEAPQPSEQALREAGRFFDHELRETTRYVPNIDKLTGARVVIGIGVDSGRLLTYRTSTALCDLLGSTPVEFPGDHVGFIGQPEMFAKTLTEALQA